VCVCALSPGSQQLDFLEGRRKQYMKAALQAKQQKDMEQAKGFLRTAKALEPLINAARQGKAVDISKVAPPPSASVGFVHPAAILVPNICPGGSWVPSDWNDSNPRSIDDFCMFKSLLFECTRARVVCYAIEDNIN